MPKPLAQFEPEYIAMELVRQSRDFSPEAFELFKKTLVAGLDKIEQERKK